MMINMGCHRVDDVVLKATRHHRIHHVLQFNRSICSSSFSSSIHTERFIIIRQHHQQQHQQQQQQFYASSRKYSISTINRSNNSSSSSSSGDGGARSSDSNKYDVLGITLFSSICVLCSGLGAWQVKRW